MTETVPVADGMETDLDAICRSVIRLLETSHGVPARLRVEAGAASVEVEWPAANGAPGAPLSAGAAVVPPRAVATAGVAGATAPPVGEGDGTEFFICADTVGTFYHAAKPGAEPFVKVGDDLEAGRQVGIVEVMKLMTPVEADRPGRVVEMLVPDGSPVEFGQRLIACAPLGER
ncbi:biotin/lipoyl-containing protein [Actinoallomurus sp. NPDC052308]|uniref:acetyl-CoA carboxylase biotin carboxyl carrier protein n=1 Tax=Actinoallomurus sp. NPDC052308 TaxID=3155530 RepID=UPI003417802C